MSDVSGRFVLTPSGEGGFVAYDPVTKTVSQGDNKDEATRNLSEAVELFCEGDGLRGPVNQQFDQDTIKDFAQFEREAALSARNVLLDEHSASFRWLMASLLAVNGGGLITFRESDLPLDGFGIIAAACFYVGMGAAFLIAMFGQRASQAMLSPVSEMVSFWNLASATGDFEETEYDKILYKVNAVGPIGTGSRVAGYTSFLAFTLGLASMLMAQHQIDQKKVKTTESKSEVGSTTKSAHAGKNDR